MYSALRFASGSVPAAAAAAYASGVRWGGGDERRGWPARARAAARCESQFRTTAPTPSALPAAAFREQYEVQGIAHLGSGVAAEVFRGRERKTKEAVAVKIFHNPSDPEASRVLADMLKTEVTLMHRVGRHPNVISLRGHYAGCGGPVKTLEGSVAGDGDVLVLDLAEGGELFDLVASQGSLDEANAATIVRDILMGLRHLHSRGVVHLDLKPENLLLSRAVGTVPSEENHIKIGDFGVSRVLPPGCRAHGAAGTVAYWAPEMVRRQAWDHGVDMWAAGCLIYILLCGAHPFDLQGNATDLQVSTLVGEGSTAYADDFFFKQLSPQARDLITRLLEPDPALRMTASEALNHDWLLEAVGRSTVFPKRRADAGGVPHRRRDTRLQGFNNLRRVRPKIMAVLAGQKLARSAHEAPRGRAGGGGGALPHLVWESETSALDAGAAEIYGDVFRTIDRNHSGAIDAAELREAFTMLGQNLSDEEVEALMEEGDLTRDGKLSFDEFVGLLVGRLGAGKGRGSRQEASKEQLRRVFEFFDEDKTGFITAEELKHVLELLGDGRVSLQDARAMVEYCDENGDGKIDLAEFESLMEQLMGEQFRFDG